MPFNRGSSIWHNVSGIRVHLPSAGPQKACPQTRWQFVPLSGKCVRRPCIFKNVLIEMHSKQVTFPHCLDPLLLACAEMEGWGHWLWFVIFCILTKSEKLLARGLAFTHVINHPLIKMFSVTKAIYLAKRNIRKKGVLDAYEQVFKNIHLNTHLVII